MTDLGLKILVDFISEILILFFRKLVVDKEKIIDGYVSTIFKTGD